MTPKDKAKELVDKMWNIDERYGSIGFHEAKQCALICVDEICEAIKPIRYGLDYINKRDDWDEVKEEIKKL
jgi:hypothetical protein